MDLLPLITLARQTDEAAFVAAHPHAQLVVRRRPRPEGERGGDPEETDWKTQTNRDLYSSGPRKPRPKGARGTCEPLVKSTRNPYAGMITVGRASNNDVCLALSSVSKLHAYFQQDGGRWTLRDSHSSFGTTVNGTRIAPDASVPIDDGAEIQFGPDTDCTFFSPRALYRHLRKLSPE